MENDFLYNFFMTDYKMIDKYNITGCNDSIERMLKRYSLGIGDYENNKLTEAIYIRIGWSNRYKDTIVSFRNVLYSAMECFSNPRNDINYRITLDDGAEVRFYNKNSLKYTINGKDKEKYCYSKAKLWEKYQDETQIIHKVMSNIFKCDDIVDHLKEVAELSDSIANFMPHPGFPFNQAKGCLADVADSLNLMVDKIQDCIDKKEELEYGESFVKLEQLEMWKNWFIDNQKTYCLDDFFDVEGDRIIGKKLFDKQGLSHPYPTDIKELKDCLSEIICRLDNRAKEMSKLAH